MRQLVNRSLAPLRRLVSPTGGAGDATTYFGSLLFQTLDAGASLKEHRAAGARSIGTAPTGPYVGLRVGAPGDVFDLVVNLRTTGGAGDGWTYVRMLDGIADTVPGAGLVFPQPGRVLARTNGTTSVSMTPATFGAVQSNYLTVPPLAGEWIRLHFGRLSWASATGSLIFWYSNVGASAEISATFSWAEAAS